MSFTTGRRSTQLTAGRYSKPLLKTGSATLSTTISPGVIPLGYSFIIDLAGNYLVDGAGNRLIAPSV